MDHKPVYIYLILFLCLCFSFLCLSFLPFNLSVHFLTLFVFSFLSPDTCLSPSLSFVLSAPSLLRSLFFETCFHFYVSSSSSFIQPVSLVVFFLLIVFQFDTLASCSCLTSKELLIWTFSLIIFIYPFLLTCTLSSKLAN